MKKTLLAVSCIAAMGLVASNANAQCAFDLPAKAKGFKSDMVRYYAGCGNSATFGAPNSVTMASVPSCTPPFANSSFLFGPKGACNVKSVAKVQNPCDQSGASGACHNTTLQGKCKDITESDGITQIDGPPPGSPWRLTTLTRASFDDQLNGDMTVIDFPAFFDFGEPKKGGMKFKDDTNRLLFDLFGAGSALPACTALHILEVNIVDTNGNVFATLGVGTTP